MSVISPVAVADAGVVHIGARGWAQIHNQDPGEGLTTVFRLGGDNAYDIDIHNGFFESFYQYWYVWTTDASVAQDDTLTTVIYGAFETGGGNDTITASIDPPAMPTQFQSAYVLAGPGNDIITTDGNVSDNALNAWGGSGNDSISGTWSDDVLYGDAADYFELWPTTSSITLAAYDASGDGNDTIYGYVGRDTLVGGGGDDILSGGQNDDSLSASSGRNQLFGGDGSDTLTGGTGSDFLYGGPRGSGNLDILTGGGGADVFLLSYSEDANAGSGFWGKYFAANVNTVTGDAVKGGIVGALADGIQTFSTGFLSSALGGVGAVLAEDFLSWIESLGPSTKPKEDVLVIRDFDPSQDVLVLPTSVGVDLSEPAATAFNPDAAGDYRTGLKFVDNDTGKLYAEVTLGTDFLASVGLTQADTNEIGRILNFLSANPTTIAASTGAFSSLSDLSAYLNDGGFSPPEGAKLPSGTSVLMFGAIGGLVSHAEPGDYSNSFIVGTQYADVLTLNPVLSVPDRLENTATFFTTSQSEVHGLGGDDIIYGTMASDILDGGAGDDLLYSFEADELGEALSGGAGNDTLLGGGSFGTFDGGAGTDTFGVFYGKAVTPMQVFIDLVNSTAGERAAPESSSAPVGPTPPFTPAADSTYTISGFENAIGGSLNDWIRAAANGTVEGGAGADYIDATAGGVTFSYSGSARGVSVQLYADGATVHGGDARGDVLDYAGAYPVGLIGSANGDTLGAGIVSGDFSFTGGGGADLFQILSITPSSEATTYTITDFSLSDGDLIDLRQIGATQSDVEYLGGHIFVMERTGPEALIEIELENFTGTLHDSDFLFAAGVSGLRVADRAGSALSGGSGDDTLLGRDGADALFGNDGADLIRGHDGADRIGGGRGNDWLGGGNGNDRITADAGHDTVAGGAGNDTIFSGFGDDHVVAGAGNDRIETGSGADRVLGGSGADTVRASSGDDSLGGGSGDDVLFGHAGADILNGGTGRDLLRGGDGNDRMLGGAGDDRMFGDAGDDAMAGGAGRDTLDGGAGADRMRGGADADLFRLVFGTLQGDVIGDFAATDGDRLVVVHDRPLAVADLGNWHFSVTDGVQAETLRVVGATVSDFDL